MFTLIRYNDHYKKKWDSFINSSKNGLFFFQRDYMDYHSSRFIDHSLIFMKGDEPVCVFPASEKESIITSHGGLTFGSLIISKNLKTVDVLNVFNQIVEYYRHEKFTEIIYKSIPYIFSNYPSQEDLYSLFRLDAEIFRRDVSSVIDIKNRINFSETKRQLIKKCVNKDIKVSENTDYSEYWELLTTVLKKFDTTPVHTLDEIENLHFKFNQNIKLFEARENGRLLAGIIIFDFGNVIHTQYMAASQEGRSIGALDFINHHLINEIYTERNYYSFGISTENSGKFLNEGLIQQKENMGARSVVLDFYRIKI